MSTPAISLTEQRPQRALPDLQERVIAALSIGTSLTQAAAEAGVHRNTINNWRRSDELFRSALTHAQYDRAILHREHAEALACDAIGAIHQILNDRTAAPSVRLRAALAILQTVTTPAPEPPPVIVDLPPIPEPLHKNAQPKPGRNQVCPCGSGLKFKRCCLNKPKTTNNPILCSPKPSRDQNPRSAQAILEVDPPTPA